MVILNSKNIALKNGRVKNILFMVLIFVLTACGGGKESSQSEKVTLPTNKNNVTIYAQDIITRTAVNDPKEIDLTNKVVLSEGDEFNIIGQPKLVSKEADNCSVMVVSDSKMIVNSEQPSDCIYQYEIAAPAAQSTRAYVRVGVATTYADNTLPTILKNMMLLDSEITVDLKIELAAKGIRLEGFDLSDDIIVLGGSGNALKVDDDTIRYFANDTEPYVKVLFSYRNTDTSEIKFGTLQLAVSDPINSLSLPTANDFTYGKELALDSNGMSEEIIIDLRDTGDVNQPSLINDPDGTQQLVNLQSSNSIVKVLDDADADMNNTKFSFQSDIPGWHEVVYTVSDHNGGYAMGTIRIMVEPDFTLIQGWEDITINITHANNDNEFSLNDVPHTFIAPLSQIAADYLNVNYTGLYNEADINNIEVITATYAQAENYCSTRNARLPIGREINELINQTGDIFKQRNWPSMVMYWTANLTFENGEVKAITRSLRETDSVALGEQATASLNSTNYVTCVELTNGVHDFSVTSEVDVDDSIKIQYNIISQVRDPDNEIAPYQFMTLKQRGKSGYFTPQALFLSTQVTTDENGAYSYSYFDQSFNTEVVGIYRGSKFMEDVTIIPLNYPAPTVDFNQNNWARGSYGTRGEAIGKYPINDKGMPLWDPRYVGSDHTGTDLHGIHLVNIYKKGFSGRNFMGRLKVSQAGENAPLAGRFTFSLQQVTQSDPSSLRGAWNYPGISNADKQIAMVLDYKNGSLSILNGVSSAGSQAVVRNLSSVRQKYVYLWYLYVDGNLKVYVSNTETRPQYPQIDMAYSWGVVNTSSDYWLALSSYGAMDYKLLQFNLAHFEYVNLVSWD